MKADRAAALLGRTRLFGDLDQDAVYRLAERADERTCEKGEIVVQEGTPGGSLFVVVTGLLKVFVTSPGGEEMVLVTLKPADVFGELALVDGGPRSASAQALERSTLLVLGRNALLEIVAEEPSLTDALLRSVGALVRRLTAQAADLVFLDLHGRVAKLLLGLAEDQGEQTESGKVLDLHMTQSDLAHMVGGSRQSVNQILRSFEERGYVELRGRQILVKEPESLRRRALP